MKGRRGRGEGAIYKRADNGIWCSIVTIGYAEDGKRKRRYVYGKTKKEVQEKLRGMHEDLAKGLLQNPSSLTVKVLLEEWLKTVAKPTLRLSTYMRYEGIIRLHIYPYIGGMKLNHLQSAHLQKLYAILERDSRKPRTIQMVHVILNRALNNAVRLKLILSNPCELVTKPKAPKKAMKFWDKDQLKKFLKLAENDRLYALYVLAITCGLRLGELFGLKWSDLNVKSSTLAVQRIVLELSGKIHIGEPKTAKGKRNIFLTNFAIDALLEHRKKMNAEGLDSEWIFCDTLGKPLRKTNFRKRSFLKLISQSKLPSLRFHDLRHSAATLLFSQGVHPKIVQELLGHAQISITLDTYSHVLPSLMQESATKLDAIFSPKLKDENESKD